MHVPKTVEALEGKRACQLACGDSHSLVLTENYEIFTFGHGGRGQLGHGDTQMRLLPTRVCAMEGLEVRSVAAGGHHSMAFVKGSKTTEIFTWGGGKSGELGHGDRLCQLAPKRLDGVAGARL